MNVLLFNLRTDASDTALGFTTAWINALARHCEQITVVTMYAGTVQVASNVEVLSLGKERGFSEPRRLLRFYRLVSAILRRQKVDVVFAHMAPLFATLFAPIAKLRGIPVLLWYAHGSVPRMLKVAHRLVDDCVSSTPEGFRLPSRKVTFIGQGVDTSVFEPPAEVAPEYESTALVVGRVTPIKNLEEILQAAALVRRRGVDLRLHVVGGALTPQDRRYEDDMHRLTRELGLSDVVDFTGPIPFTQVAAHYRQGGLFINLCDSALDKAIVESMASGCLPICRNTAFRAVATANDCAQLVPRHGAEAVAECIMSALEMPAEEKEAIRRRLRGVAVEQHSLEALAGKLAARLRRLCEARASS